jgi:hypothetical protein
VANYIVNVKIGLRQRPGSDDLPGKPICLLHEGLAGKELPDFVAGVALIPPPPPPEGPFELSEGDLPLPPDRRMDEIADPGRTGGEIELAIGGTPEAGQIAELHKLLARACVGSPLNPAWFDIVPPV